MLIYEYMPNKSLDWHIFNENQSMLLDWPQRFHIIDGIARGLLYLHQDSRLRIIHRDLKAGNILLEKDMNPKISDFGLARSFIENENEANTNRVVEYAVDGLFCVKSDVFSFGVLVLEIVSGRRNK
ncbi:Protein kinase domain-containing protein [Heracleum sosnowskyi]|uniref:Protein kinase domain-containing protein n=1 Tax=Heracleum sosnowskyi TaxID=360622 RepID=A0AAD8N0Y9_9APIA|nr:Protein kinase domain-containing protein [Heracleum sosnowskyi]